MRFWIGKTESVQSEEEKTEVLRVVMWPEPFALKHTPEEEKIQKDFEFSEEGLDAVYGWICKEGRDAVLQMHLET